MKIKKFRIRPRLFSVGRLLKSMLSVKQLPAELEDAIPRESQEFLAHASPSAFYQNWNSTEVPLNIKAIVNNGGYDKAVAISALVATIGTSPEEYLSEVLMSGEAQRAQLVTALAEESADLSLGFLYRLLQDDAKADDCEASPLFPVTDPEHIAHLLTLLEADQEGVTLDAASHLVPRFTRVALVAWMPVSKKKKLTHTPKKKFS